MFPDTPQTLLRRIVELAQGDDAAEWQVFVELYTPPLRHFIGEMNSTLSVEDVEDAVQEVFVRLVEVLREGRYDRTKAKFRAFLATMTRRILIDHYRAMLVRPQGTVSAEDELQGTVTSAAFLDPARAFDFKWRISVHEAAVAHVLEHTAIAPQSREIYRALSASTPKEVAARFGVTGEVVRQVKSRVDRAIAALEHRLLQD